MADAPIVPFSSLDKRRQCKFIQEWTLRTDFSSWLVPVEVDPHKAFCVCCKKVFPVSHGGLHDVKAHAKGKRHLLLSQQYFQENHFLKKLQEPRTNHEWNPHLRPPIFDSELVDHLDVSINTFHIPYKTFQLSNMNSRPSTMDTSQQYCLRWKYHHSNLQLMFSQLLERESFCDVTLACEGRHIRAHKVMLSACSTYFDSILSQHDENNPIVVFKDVRFEDLKALVQFMYKGEIKIENTQLTPLLKTAEELRIKGLAPSTHRNERAPNPFPHRPERVQYEEQDEEEMCESPAKRARMSEHVSWHRPMPVPISHITPAAALIPKQDPKKYEEEEDHEDIEVLTQRARHNEQNTTDRIREQNKEQNERDDHEDDLNDDDDDEMPLPIAPETVYDNDENEELERDEERQSEEEREGWKMYRKKDENGNEEEEEFQMPGMPAHLTNSAFSSLLEEDDDGHRIHTSSEEKSIDYSKYSWVMKMNEFLDKGGRRPQFWEESSTRRVMEAIKNKELEMKQGAEIMGVSYGTLYGRYRDAYGCLKHPYRVKEFWSDQGPNEILTKLRRKELTLFRAAELLNVTQTTLANYLATLRHPSPEPMDPEDYETPPSLFAKAEMEEKELEEIDGEGKEDGGEKDAEDEEGSIGDADKGNGEEKEVVSAK